MKRSKRKSGYSSATKRSSGTPTQRRPIEPHFPSDEAWINIARDLKLTPAQRDTLKITLREALDEIAHFNMKLQNQPNPPSRALLIDRLKPFKKALDGLMKESRGNAGLMQSFLPHNTLAYIGQSLTFSAISEALGRDVFPKNFDFKIALKRSQGERITFASMEDLSRPRRETLGLEYGGAILMHFIDRIHAPFEKWLEFSRQNEGGRPANAARKHLIYQLAEAAPDIIGKPATVAGTGTFVDLCTSVLQACGLSAIGIAEAIPPVVKKLRADQKRWRRGNVQ
jgi:hypothetical protein